ncbi:hypothetical protein [Luethyella okanaganae]|uniref:Cell division protein FtsL n=1 Tax=Luethyella okanaganae TaxID=69372 RepID=A0ABW1VH74_9MICO
MSDNLARIQLPNWLDGTEPNPADEHRRRIEIVASREQRRARPRLAYALVAVAGIVVIVVAQLLISVGLSQGAYEISSLQGAQKELARTAQTVSEDLDRVRSPQYLAANAEALGMVTNASPVMLRLSDGAVTGLPAGGAEGAPGASALVPNSLLTGVPLVTQLLQAGGQGASAPVPAPTSVGAAGSGTPDVPPATPAASQLPLQNGLPSPTTH